MAPRGARDIVVLARPVDDEHSAVLALLNDGESWSSSALALALGTSQRSVQRALDSLATAGRVQSLGSGALAGGWRRPCRGSRHSLLLPVPLPTTRMDA
jgi:predicted ArsR family transcriptional regulator